MSDNIDKAKIKKAKMLLQELESLKEGDFEKNGINMLSLVAEALKDAEALALMVADEDKAA
jgi:hypothetical protein